MFPVILGTMVVTPLPVSRPQSQLLPAPSAAQCSLQRSPGHLFPVQPQEDISCQPGLLEFRKWLSECQGLEVLLSKHRWLCPRFLNNLERVTGRATTCRFPWPDKLKAYLLNEFSYQTIHHTLHTHFQEWSPSLLLWLTRFFRILLLREFTSYHLLSQPA